MSGPNTPPSPEELALLTKVLEIADNARSTGEKGFDAFLRLSRNTPLHLNPILLNTFAQAFGEQFTPYPIVLFAPEFLARRKPASVCDPCAGAGLYLSTVVSKIPNIHAVGLIRTADEFATARLIDAQGKIEWQNGDPLLLLDELHETFDAITSVIPFGMAKQELILKHGDKALHVHDERGRLILLKSAMMLNPEGVGLFVVPNSFFLDESPHSVKAVLGQIGLRVTASLFVPAGSFRPATSIAANLIVVEHGEGADLFVGELGEKEHSAILLENLSLRRESDELALGRLVDAATFRGYQRLQLEEKIRRMAADFDAPAVTIAEAVIEANLADREGSFPEKPNSVFVPTIGRSAAVADIAEGGLKPHNYIQMVLRDSLADARYVAGFLNTPLGLAIRESLNSGTTIPKLAKKTLEGGSLYLPSREIQIRTVESSAAVSTIISNLKELERELWEHPGQIDSNIGAVSKYVQSDSLTEWIDYLPFPLASILWTYHSVERSPKEAYEHLLHFFEALAEFMATVLLSAFTSRRETFEAERPGLQKALAAAGLSFERASFGTWKVLLEYLGKRGRALLHGSNEDDKEFCYDLFGCRNPDTLEMIFSKALVANIQEVSSRRNQWTGHGGIVGDRDARDRHSVLKSDLAKIREIFQRKWSSYELVQPQNCQFRGGIFENEVARLLGPRTPFEIVQRDTSTPLETGALYLLSSYEARGLRLLPLVKIMPAPKTEQNACYFYNRRQKGGVRFISYHFDREAEVVEEFSDMADVLTMLQQGTS